MKIERKKKWRVGLGVAVAVVAGWTTWLAAVPGPGTGHSFTPASLASPFTQDLYATTGNLPLNGILGGVAFTPDGRVWSAECNFLGTRLHRFASATTAINGSSVHEEELVVDLTSAGPTNHDIGGCGLVNHPDGFLYSTSKTGIWKLNATTGEYVAGPFGHGGNALGIAVDPKPGAGHHLVYVGNDCHPSLNPFGTTCTLWDWDPATPAAPSQIFARLSIPEDSDVLIDGLYFDPSGEFLFAAHRERVFIDSTHITKLNSLEIIRRPVTLPALGTDSQLVRRIAMASEPDGVAFHAADGFVVTLNESLDCVNGSGNVVASDPITGACTIGTTPIGGTMTRFDFAGADYTQVPTASTFAYGGFRGDLMQVGPDGCIYATQGRLAASGGTLGTRYDNDVTTGDNSLVQICGGFVPPPGVTHEETAPASIAGLVFFDANHNGVRDSNESGLAGVPVTLSTDPTHPVSSLADGTFLFDQLAAGTYTVTTPATALYLAGSITLSTVGSSGAINLTAHEQKSGYEFGYAPGSIAGTVFQDLNHNALRDSGEPPLDGVTVTLAGAAGGTAISAADGSYKFNLLASGDYTVTAPATAGGATTGTLVLTTVGSRGVTLAPGQDKPDVDFGYAPQLTIACLSPETGQVGVAYSGSAVASGGLAPYTYAIVGTLPAGLVLDAATGEINGTPTATGGSFSVAVTDATGASASTATSGCPVSGGGVTIAPAPLAIACVSPATGQVGVAYSGSAVASGGVLPYTYAIVGTVPAGLTLNTATGAITGTPTATGSFSVKVTDSNGAGASTATSACSVAIAPAALTISCVSPATGQVGVAYSGSAVANGGVLPYTYAIVGTLPAGLTLDASTGQITGTPTATGSFTVKVTDANGAGASTATSACSVAIAPAPLTISCVSPATGQVGVAYSGSAEASGGVAPYTYAIVGTLPAGLTLNTATGAITGTPTATGSFSVKVTDSNGAGASTATSACSVTIAPALLTIACVSPATGQVGVAYSGSAVASGGVLPYTYAIVGTLPAGLTLNTATGAITGTPTATGSFSVKVTDSNGAGASTATSACSVAIAPAPPALACVAATTGRVGAAYSSSLVATGGEGAPYTYSIISGSLPNGLTLNASTGAITGTPTTAGPFAFTAQVVDARGTAAGTTTSSSCGITIAPAPPALSCVAVTTGQVGVAYNSSLVATGGAGAPYTYSIIVGSLPLGLTLNASTGAITGTPTTAGPFAFTAQVVDARGTDAGTSTSSSCGITIAPAPLTIACLSPATGQVGVAYSGSAVASGGVLPYAYAIVGTLPAGLTLNTSTGAITGTPTATGSFSVKVTDSNGAGASTATSACSVAIAPAALTISCVSPATGQVGVAYSGNAVASGGVLPYTYAIVGTLPAGLTLNTATGQISGTPTATGSFSVKVTDSNGAGASTATSACSVAIAPAALTISCVSPATGQVGVAYSGNAVASGGVLPYTYAIVGTLPAGLTLNTATGQISGTPTATGSFSVKVTDSNGAGASTATSACSVTIAPAAPTLACVAATTGQVGVAYSSSLVATGGVGPYTYSIISGSLPTGLTLNASTGAITGTPTTAGPFAFTAQVVDARGTAAGTTTSSSCGITIAPAPPALSCVAATTGQVGVAYSSSLVATGGVGPYTYSIISGSLPTGLTLNASTGAITGTPTTAGSFPFTAKVVDSRGTAAGTSTNSCGITIAPAAPTLACVAATTGQVGVAYNSSLVATGGVGPYTYSIISGSLPTGLTLNASTGAITGTPTTAGPFAFTAQVVDARGTAAGTTTSSSCGITIAPAPPALSCVAATTGQVGVAYSSSLVATGGVGPYTYSIISGSLPTGLTLNASTGAITGTPTTAGSFPFTAKVVDSRGTAAGTSTNSCGITIAPAAPTLACVAATTGQVGVAYSSSLVATGGVGPYTYSIISGSLPTGLTLNASTGAITGTPTAAGSFPFTAKVVDSRGTAAGTSTNSCGITTSPKGSISGFAYIDANKNSVRDTGEAGIGGVTMTLSGAASASTTTAADGSYTFTALVAGTYSVSAPSTAAGLLRFTTSPLSVTLAAGELRTNVNFGYVSGSISGFTYVDANKNGVRDTGEAGIGGITMTLSGAASASATTAADGSYTFTALVAGTYSVAAPSTAAGLLRFTTSPLSVTLAAGELRTNVNFGYVSGSISGFAYVDANRNGVKDAGEAGIGGVTITGPGGATTSTAADGSYSFSNLNAGTYSVSAPSTASGKALFTASPLSVTVAAGGTSPNNNFGYVTGTISGYTYFDTNRNGVRDSGEPAVSGVPVTLAGVGTVNSDANGFYSFAGLSAATYSDSAAATASGLTLTTPSPLSVTLAAGATSVNNNFGYLNAVTTGDTGSVGYWKNQNGQSLIRAVNGGPTAKNFATWLATNFPYLYGSYSGSYNLTGKTNNDVAALFVTLFNNDKNAAQVMAGAIAAYVTSSTLAGGNYAASYGFTVTPSGIGTKLWNVGSYGTAIGLSNNTYYTLMQLLQQANLRKQQGLFDATAFSAMFSLINAAGHIV